MFDTAFGYMSSFRTRDIAYYVLTRSLSATVSRVVIHWEPRRMQIIAHIRPHNPSPTSTVGVQYPRRRPGGFRYLSTRLPRRKVDVLSEERATCIFKPHERPVPG